MLGFLVFVFFLLAGYALFHSFLAVVNQTSNEWYKSRGYTCQHCHPTADHLCSPAPDHSKRYYYSRGLLRNMGEIFFPPQPVQKKDNWKKKILPSLLICCIYCTYLYGVYYLWELLLTEEIKFMSVLSLWAPVSISLKVSHMGKLWQHWQQTQKQLLLEQIIVY